MKILLISSSSGSHGGGEFYLHGLAEGLLGRGHNVHVALSTHEKMDALADGFCGGVQVHRIGFQNTYDYRTRVFGCHFSKQADKNLPPLLNQIHPDVIHLNKQNLEDGLDLLRTIRQCDCASLITIHVTRSARSLGAMMGGLRDRYSQDQLNRYPGAFVATANQCCDDLQEFLGDGFAGSSPHLHPQSPQLDRPFREKFALGSVVSCEWSRCHVVHNGVPASESLSTEFWSRSADQRLCWLCEVASLEDRFAQQVDCELILGTVARIEEQKNPLMAVKILKHLPESIHWAWIGDGRMRGELEAAAQAAGVTGRLHLLGWQSDARRFMPAFDVFALPSLYEGFPFAILEAMAECLPCVVSDVDGCREAVIEGQTGFLCPHDEVAVWADRILKLHQESQKREQMAQSGHQRWESHFSLDAMAAATEAIYLKEIARYEMRDVSREG